MYRRLALCFNFLERNIQKVTVWVREPASAAMQTPAIPDVTFVVAVNQREVFERNFLSSPCLCQMADPQIQIQEGFDSASKAYNDALGRSRNDLMIFVHQDVILPET